MTTEQRKAAIDLGRTRYGILLSTAIAAGERVVGCPEGTYTSCTGTVTERIPNGWMVRWDGTGAVTFCGSLSLESDYE